MAMLMLSIGLLLGVVFSIAAHIGYSLYIDWLDSGPDPLED